jgi:hypothetical protein
MRGRRGRSTVFALALLGLLALAPAAHGAEGVYNYFGTFGSAGGQTIFGGGKSFNGIAVNASGAGGAVPGDVYVADESLNRIQRFDADGGFVAAWGEDVVKAGAPGDTGTGYEVCIVATDCKGAPQGGLSGPAPGSLAGELSSPRSIAVDPSNGNVYVGNTGNRRIDAFSATGNPLRAWGQDVVSSGPGDTGTGFEVCVSASGDVCKQGVGGSTAGAFGSVGGLSAVTVAPAGAPNAGNLVIADASNRRVQEFTPAGVFVRAFGWDVASAGPGNTGTGFEVCAAGVDTCKIGVAGSGTGQFGSGNFRIAENAAGAIYVAESIPNSRVQRFTLPGNVVVAHGTYDPEGRLSGTSTDDNVRGIAVDGAGVLYAVKGFPAGSGTPPASAAEGRILRIDPSANGGEGGVVATFLSNAGILKNSNTLALNPVTQRLYATENGAPPALQGAGYAIDDIPPLSATMEPSEIGAATATFHAAIAPAAIPLPTSYRFEYAKAGSGEWKSTPSVEIGNGSGAGSPESCPAGNPPLCRVSLEVQNLEFGETYQVRVVASTPFHGAEAVVEGEQITTHAIPPLVTTGGARWSSPPASGPSLTVSATINPGHDETTYFFQYASEEEFQAQGFGSARVVPLLPAAAGHGLENVEVLQSIPGLDPAKTYRYRVVATNSTGTATGNERSVDPPDPTARFYELLTVGETGGLGANGLEAIADSGNRVAILAQALGDPHGLPNQTSPFLAERGASGWSIAQVTPDPGHTRTGSFLGGGYVFPADLSRALWGAASVDQYVRREVDFIFANPDETFTQALPRLVPVASSGWSDYLTPVVGASTDLSTFLFQVSSIYELPVAYLPGQPLTTAGEGDLYRVRDAGGLSPTLTLLNRDPSGNLISNACGVALGVGTTFAGTGNGNDQVAVFSLPGMSLRPVSSDGSVAYFSARPSGSSACKLSTNRARIFKRIEDTSTVEVSASQCTRTIPTPCSTANGDDVFQGASSNGSRAFFTTTRQLVNSDEDSTQDLYLYDSSPPAGQPTLVQASAGEVTAGHATVGKGAETQGVVDISADGSRIYFVAKGQLTSAATKGAFNLYVYERDEAHPAGRIAFVAKLDAGDEPKSLWGGGGGRPAFALPYYGGGGAGAGDGHFLLFSSLAKLVAEDTDTAADLYRYDDTASQLICLTCAGNGDLDIMVKPHSEFMAPNSFQSNRVASEDLSTVVFATEESLLPADANAVADAYEWHEGRLGLVSPGNSGSSGLEGAPIISPDGLNVVFLTEDRILPADRTTALDAYDARLGGGFPEAAEEQSCVSADECRAEPIEIPAVPSQGTSSFSGTGNLTPSKTRCAKGKVRKHGKCTKQKKKKKRSRSHRPRQDRGGKR